MKLSTPLKSKVLETMAIKRQRILFNGWGIVMQPKRGGPWSHPEFTARTRAQAIEQFLAMYKDCSANHPYLKKWSHHRRLGVRCLRVQLVMTDE